MIKALRMAAVAAILSMGLPSAVRATPKPPPAPRFQSIVGFCAAQGTVDHPPERGFGPPAEGGVPPELTAIGANKWRCMEKEVLVCADSADGDQCSVKSADRNPPSLIAECRGAPNSREISFASGHFSQFDWACRGGKPVITRTYPLDRRGFFEKAWARLVVKNGVVVSPKQAPEILR